MGFDTQVGTVRDFTRAEAITLQSHPQFASVMKVVNEYLMSRRLWG
jgi:hypothetical protein